MHINIYKHQQHHHSNSTTSYNSHNSSKGGNTSYYDKHHIQHPSIIHTSSFIHNKLVIKDFQGNQTQIIFNQVRLIFHDFKTTKTIEPKLRKTTQLPQLCIHINHI